MICYRCSQEIRAEAPECYGLHLQCFTSWFGLEAPGDFSTVSPQNRDSGKSENEFNHFNSSFFHGKFKKYSANLGQDSYVLKVQEPDYPDLPAIELLSNQIAHKLGLEIPEYYLIRFHDLPTFVSKNFIRHERYENLVHIYRYIGERPFDCKTIIDIIETETKRLSEVERFVELCLFDALIGNHDRHGRNLAIIESRNQKRLAPFYDNPTYIGIESDFLLEADLSPRGKIATSSTEEPSVGDYISEFTDLGFVNVIRKFHAQALEACINDLITASFVSEKRQKAFSKLVAKNLLGIQNVI